MGSLTRDIQRPSPCTSCTGVGLLAGFSCPLILNTAAPAEESGVRPGMLREDVDPPRPPLPPPPPRPTQWTVPPRSLARRAKAKPGRRLLSQNGNRHIGRNPRSPPLSRRRPRNGLVCRSPLGPLATSAAQRRGEGQARPQSTRGGGWRGGEGETTQGCREGVAYLKSRQGAGTT